PDSTRADRLALDQAVYLRVREAYLAQHLARVLAQAWRQAVDAGGAGGEPRRRARLADLSFRGVIQFREHAHRFQVRLFRNLGQFRERRVRHVNRQQQHLPIRRRPAWRDVAHAVIDPIDITRTQDRIADGE